MEFLSAFFWVFLSLQVQALNCAVDGKQTFVVENSVYPDAAQKLDVFYGSAYPVDNKRPVILVIPGGPGGTYEDVKNFINKPELKEIFKTLGNIITFDHRGTGCTKILNPNLPAIDKELWSVQNASRDIEAVRLDFLSRFHFAPGTKVIVVGFSYGGILGQQYLLDYPQAASRALIGATVTSAYQFQLARSRYKDLMINDNPKAKKLFEQIILKFPGSHDAVLRAIFPFGYSLKKRTKDLPLRLKQFLNAKSDSEFRSLLAEHEKWYVEEEKAGGMVPCSSVWDFPAEQPENKYFFSMWYERCQSLRHLAKPFDVRGRHSEIKIPILLMGGGNDHVTPVDGIYEMHRLLPDSILWVNKTSGHSIRDEKPLCFISLLTAFVREAPKAAIQALADSPFCQAPSNTF